MRVRTYKDTAVSNTAGGDRNETKRQNDAVNDVIHNTERAQDLVRQQARNAASEESVQTRTAQPAASKRSWHFDVVLVVVLGLLQVRVVLGRGGRTAGTLTAVAGPPVLVLVHGRVQLLALHHALRQEGRALVLVADALGAASGVGIDNANDELRNHHGAGDPADLVMRIVQIQIGRGGVVDQTKEDAESIHKQEDELRGDGKSRVRDTEHDSCRNVS